jgi:hypothetical protein
MRRTSNDSVLTLVPVSLASINLDVHVWEQKIYISNTMKLITDSFDPWRRPDSSQRLATPSLPRSCEASTAAEQSREQDASETKEGGRTSRSYISYEAAARRIARMWCGLEFAATAWARVCHMHVARLTPVFGCGVPYQYIMSCVPHR